MSLLNDHILHKIGFHSIRENNYKGISMHVLKVFLSEMHYVEIKTQVNEMFNHACWLVIAISYI